MASAKTKSSTAELLEQLFKNIKMGSDSIVALLPKVENEDSKFKSDLTLQLNGYESLVNRINGLFREAGEEAKQDSLMTKMTAKVGTAMSTLMDSSVSHMADMLIQGSTTNMNDTIKLIREFENTTASEGSLAIAREIVKFEEENIARMKPYL